MTLFLLSSKNSSLEQLDVKRDLASRLVDDPTADQALLRWLDHHVETEASDLHGRELWNLYCGTFEN